MRSNTTVPYHPQLIVWSLETVSHTAQRSRMLTMDEWHCPVLETRCMAAPQAEPRLCSFVQQYYMCIGIIFELWKGRGAQRTLGSLPWCPSNQKAQLGIGIEETNAGIGNPASRILVGYRTKKMPDCVSLVRYRTCSVILRFFQSGTGLTRCRTVRHSGISTYMYMDIDMDMKH